MHLLIKDLVKTEVVSDNSTLINELVTLVPATDVAILGLVEKSEPKSMLTPNNDVIR